MSVHNVEFVSSASQKTHFFYHIAADREPCAAPRKWLVLVFVPLISICCLSPHFPFVDVFFLLFFAFSSFVLFILVLGTRLFVCIVLRLRYKNSVCFLALDNFFLIFKTKRMLLKRNKKLSTHLGRTTLTNKPVFSPAFTHGGIVPLNTLGFGAKPT